MSDAFVFIVIDIESSTYQFGSVQPTPEKWHLSSETTAAAATATTHRH